MNKILIGLENKSNNSLPEYAHNGDSGMDIRAYVENNKTIKLKPLERRLIHSGLFVKDIPDGYEIQVRPRSGLALKYGITVLNTPGTIDSNYRGEIGVIMINLGDNVFEINNGDKIAQLVVCKVEKAEVTTDIDFTDSDRGDKGYGSSGRN